MANVVKAIRDSGLKDVRTMIGGAPVTQQFANDIGADGYAPDAASAVEVATRLVPAKA
jgi:5-methyltetrahydrofolate--homocysteine methyltransferase